MTLPTTDQGRQTQEKILATAARLMHERGVRRTSVDDVLAASGTGKGQFYHYFSGKDQLVREVLRYQLERFFSSQRSFLEHLDTWEGIEAWFAFVVRFHRDRRLLGGCPIGSLAAEMADDEEALRRDLVAAFDAWQGFLKRGLAAMKRRGDLSPEASPDALAQVVLSAIQGGILLGRTRQDVKPLKHALAGAMRCLRSYSG
jgi:AcrR family transcriptional regulator